MGIVVSNQSKTITFVCLPLGLHGKLYGYCNNLNLILILLQYRFDQPQAIDLFDFVLFLYLALPLSLGSMAVTGGLIYNGKALTLKPFSSITS